MQVFDFTNGVKGKKIGEFAHPVALGGWHVKKGDQTFKVELSSPNNVAPIARNREGVSWKWSADASHMSDDGLTQIDPRDFGVEAVCFCIGLWKTFGQAILGDDEWTWQWHVVGTNKWNREACKSGILKSTKVVA